MADTPTTPGASPSLLTRVRSYLKQTAMGTKIYHSDFWQKRRNPYRYHKHLAELAFYRNVLFKHADAMNLIFDVGANVGDKSAVFSKLARKVVAFEPTERLYLSLKKRFRNTNVEVMNYALGSTVGKLDFFEVPDNAAYNSLSRKHIDTIIPTRNIASESVIQTKKIQVEQIDHFIDQYGVPDYIKIDVEGYEFEVLKGLKTAVPLISFEANLPDFHDESICILEYLDGLASDKYVYNFTYGESFILDQFVRKPEAIEVLAGINTQCVEIYAKLAS